MPAATAVPRALEVAAALAALQAPAVVALVMAVLAALMAAAAAAQLVPTATVAMARLALCESSGQATPVHSHQLARGICK